jgi:hypothetical protein
MLAMPWDGQAYKQKSGYLDLMSRVYINTERRMLFHKLKFRTVANGKDWLLGKKRAVDRRVKGNFFEKLKCELKEAEISFEDFVSHVNTLMLGKVYAISPSKDTSAIRFFLPSIRPFLTGKKDELDVLIMKERLESEVFPVFARLIGKKSKDVREMNNNLNFYCMDIWTLSILMRMFVDVSGFAHLCLIDIREGTRGRKIWDHKLLDEIVGSCLEYEACGADFKVESKFSIVKGNADGYESLCLPTKFRIYPERLIYPETDKEWVQEMTPYDEHGHFFKVGTRKKVIFDPDRCKHFVSLSEGMILLLESIFLKLRDITKFSEDSLEQCVSSRLRYMTFLTSTVIRNEINGCMDWLRHLLAIDNYLVLFGHLPAQVVKLLKEVTFNGDLSYENTWKVIPLVAELFVYTNPSAYTCYVELKKSGKYLLGRVPGNHFFSYAENAPCFLKDVPERLSHMPFLTVSKLYPTSEGYDQQKQLAMLRSLGFTQLVQ